MPRSPWRRAPIAVLLAGPLLYGFGCSKDAAGPAAGVASVVMNPLAASVVVGGTVQLDAGPLDAGGTRLGGRTVQWSSADAGIASVSSSGLVEGRAVGGPVTITATVEGRSATAQVTVVPQPVASVIVTPPTTSVEVGATVRLSAATRGASGGDLPGRVVTWISDNTTLATVSQDGVVTGVAVGGPVTITATSEGRTGSATITVTPQPVASVTVSPETATLGPGFTIALSAVTRNASGAVLTGRPVTWSSSNAAVASVDGGGVVTGVAAGVADIVAASEGRADTARVTVVPATTRRLAGQLHRPGGESFTGLEVSLTSPVGVRRATVTATGAFELDVPLGSDSVTLMVDGPLPRRFHPARIRNVADAIPAAPRIIMVPRAWQIGAGTYAGTTVSVSMQAALTPYTPTEPWAGFWYRTHLPSAHPAWPVNAFPVRVAFDRAGSTNPISAADSVGFWNLVRALEADVGMSLFTPVNYPELPPADGVTTRGIHVRVNTAVGGGSAGWAAGADATIRSVEVMTHPTLINDQGVVTHEMVHALGIGHTPSWTSVMGASSRRVTAGDAAHIQLLYAIEWMRRTTGAQYGMFEAWQGERVLVLGLPPAQPPYDR